MTQTFSAPRVDDLNQSVTARLFADLYGAAIDHLGEAVSAIRRNDIQGRCNAITAAIHALGEALDHIDLESGSEIAGNLLQIHNFVVRQLPLVNFRNEPKYAIEAMFLLEPIRDAWLKVDELLNAKPVIDPATIAAVQGAKPRLAVVARSA